MTEATASREDFASSAARFAEAAKALDEFREHLGALSEFKAQQKESAEALHEGSVALHAAVEALSPVGKIGAEILASLKEAVAAAEVIFDQETILGIRSDITALGEEVRTLNNDTASPSAPKARPHLLRAGQNPSRTRRIAGQDCGW